MPTINVAAGGEIKRKDLEYLHMDFSSCEAAVAMHHLDLAMADIAAAFVVVGCHTGRIKVKDAIIKELKDSAIAVAELRDIGFIEPVGLAEDLYEIKKLHGLSDWPVPELVCAGQLKHWAADHFSPPIVPHKLTYKSNPVKHMQIRHTKQPTAKGGFKRGNRN